MRTYRLASAADADACLSIYRPLVEGTAVSFETEVPSLDDFAGRVAKTLEQYPWLVCEQEGEVVGYAYACLHRARAAYRWCVEVSAYVHQDHRRRGIARGLYSRLVRALEAQGFANAYAGIALPNDASVAFHESVGFEPVGVYRSVGYKLGRWHDVGWWALRLRGRDVPEPPRPLRECASEVAAIVARATD